MNHRETLARNPLTRLVGSLAPYSQLLTKESEHPDISKPPTSAHKEVQQARNTPGTAQLKRTNPFNRVPQVPKESQQTQDTPGATQPKRTNPFMRVPQVSKEAQQAQNTPGPTQPKRTNPFARVPQVSSASAGPSSSSQLSSLSQPSSPPQTASSSRYGAYRHRCFSTSLNTLPPAIPDIRRPGLFPARQQGNDPLSPPAANLKAKNPFKERKRKT